MQWQEAHIQQVLGIEQKVAVTTTTPFVVRAYFVDRAILQLVLICIVGIELILFSPLGRRSSLLLRENLSEVTQREEARCLRSLSYRHPRIIKQ